MSFQIHEITADLRAHISRIMEIQFSAFDGEPYHEVLYPGGNIRPSREAAGVRVIQELEHTPQQRILAAVETETGTTVGFAKWNFYEKERPREEWAKREEVDWCGGDEELKRRAEVFLGATFGVRERLWEGRRHVLCALLCVHRSHQRRGVGTLLMNWGLEEARKLGLPAYLEASYEGHPLYLKLGFREIDKVVVKKDDWHGEFDRVYLAMIMDWWCGERN